MSLTIVMYHYVRDAKKTDFPNINSLPIKIFCEQVERLKKKYTFVSLANIARDQKLPANACVLSFDDGLKDHYQNVLPVLKEKNISGAFFPITYSFEGRVADAHKVHFLLARCGTEVLVEKFHQFLKSRNIEEQKKYLISSNEKIDPRYRFDDILTANLKVRLNTLPDLMRSDFLENVFSEFIGDESKFAKKLYLSKAEIKEMADAGMIIGSHTITHRRLDKLSNDEQRHELKASKECLEEVAGKTIISLSYPYGSYNDSTLEIARELGYSIALGTEVGVNEGKLNLLALKRLNANDL